MALYIDKKTITGFGLSLMMLILTGIVVYRNSVAFREVSVRQQHALSGINSLDKILTLALNAETAVRGYSLTGEDSFLEPYRTAVTEVNQEIENLRALMRGESDQLVEVNKLEPLLIERLAISQHNIEVRQRQGLAAVAQVIARGEGKRVTDEIRGIVDKMEGAERQRIAVEGQTAPSRARNTLAFIVLETAFALVFLGLAGVQINRREKRRQLAEQALQQAHGTLEQRVRQRTAELESSNESLRKALDDHKRAEEHLRRSEGRFNNLLESAPDAMIVANRAGQIVFANGVAERMFGYQREELLDQRMDMLMPERFRAEPGRSPAEFFASPRTRSMGATRDLFARRKDGSEFPIEVSLAPVEGEEEMLVSASIRDVSERKELEERLQQSQKMDAVGRLAGGVAHDFNNLLTVINGYSNLLLGGLDARDPMRERITQIRNAGGHAAELTQQLLAFSRKQILQPKVLDLNQLVGDVEKMLRRLVGENIEIVTTLSPQAELVMADPGQMTQVLMNLAVNARDAMPGGGQLAIETARLDLDATYAKVHPEVEPGQYVRLAMTDSGIGMDEATRSRIFEPFYTTKGNGEGTGLGLATVYGIVKQAGGSIWVYSEPGKGTTFKVYLPRVSEAPLPEPAPKIGNLRGDETILVVEDQTDLRKLAKEILESHGYTVLTAADGGQAIWQAERHAGPIQLMLTDVVMPGMTARELAGRMKPLRPATKVLYMSGYTDDVVVHRGIVDLGVAYIQKPFTPGSLAAKVREVLGPVRPAATILVVDDEAGIRGLLRDLLKTAGYEVLEAEDGRQAMTQVETHHVDLMITDLIMPEQEGIETIGLLRQRQPNLKIIAMSGAMDSVFLEAASHLGTQATVAKPFNNEKLLETVQRVLAQ